MGSPRTHRQSGGATGSRPPTGIPPRTPKAFSVAASYRVREQLMCVRIKLRRARSEDLESEKQQVRRFRESSGPSRDPAGQRLSSRRRRPHLWLVVTTDEDRRGLTALFWSNVNPYSIFRLDRQAARPGAPGRQQTVRHRSRDLPRERQRRPPPVRRARESGRSRHSRLEPLAPLAKQSPRVANMATMSRLS